MRNNILQEAIKDLNEIRKVAGLPSIAKLPRGIQNSATSCPISNSLRADGCYDIIVTTGIFEFKKLNGVVEQAINAKEVPDSIAEFILRFDEGEFPSLVVQPKES